jgi:hypothetical protein
MMEISRKQPISRRSLSPFTIASTLAATPQETGGVLAASGMKKYLLDRTPNLL